MTTCSTCGQVLPTKQPTGADVGEQCQIRVSGSDGHFRCPCGCNVFTKVDGSYRCNSCSAAYAGDEKEAVEVLRNSKWDDCEMEIDKDVQLILSGVAKKKQWRWSLIALRRDYSSVDLAWGECGEVRDLNAARAVAEQGARTYLETLLSVLDDGRCKGSA